MPCLRYNYKKRNTEDTEMNGIRNGIILLPDGERKGMTLVFDRKVREILPNREAERVCEHLIDAEGAYVCPGLVDVHIHGYGGADVSDGSAEGIRSIAEGILKNGVTSFCPTTMTVSMPEIIRALETCRALKAESRDWDGAEILGVHAEGPFISPAKKGAQAEAYILPPDATFVREYADILSLITLAPEVPGALACIRQIREETDVVVSAGHSCADFAQTREGIEAGVTHATHLFNAMTPLQHREPGAVGALLSDPSVFCELIADTFHVHPGLYPMLYQLKKDRLVLISDCIRAGGLADGSYTLGGQPVSVRGIECRLPDGTIAGSVLKLNRAVKNILDHTDLPVYEAVHLASLSPARSVGAVGKGSLLPGMDADLFLADPEFRVLALWKNGVRKF